MRTWIWVSAVSRSIDATRAMVFLPLPLPYTGSGWLCRFSGGSQAHAVLRTAAKQKRTHSAGLGIRRHSPANRLQPWFLHLEVKASLAAQAGGVRESPLP